MSSERGRRRWPRALAVHLAPVPVELGGDERAGMAPLVEQRLSQVGGVVLAQPVLKIALVGGYVAVDALQRSCAEPGPVIAVQQGIEHAGMEEPGVDGGIALHVPIVALGYDETSQLCAASSYAAWCHSDLHPRGVRAFGT